MRTLILTLYGLFLSHLLWGQGSYAPLLHGTWDGDWVDNSGFLFTFKMELDLLSNENIEGKIQWLLVKHPADREDYVHKIGKRGTEFVRGKITLDKVFLEGYRKQDPHQIIGLDKYNLRLDCKEQTLDGETYDGGTWEGRFFALRRAALDTSACFAEEQSIHYCQTLSLDYEAYPNAAARADFYQWIQQYVACKEIDIFYFYLPEWTLDLTSGNIQAADTGQETRLSTDYSALSVFQEALNKQIFIHRMQVARQVISASPEIKFGLAEDKQWIVQEEKSNQSFLASYPNFEEALLPLIQQNVVTLSRENIKPNFWRMLRDKLPSTQKLDFKNEALRIEKHQLNLDFLRNL